MTYVTDGIMPHITVLTETATGLPQALPNVLPIWTEDSNDNKLQQWATMLTRACAGQNGALCLTSTKLISNSYYEVLEVAGQLQRHQVGPIRVIDTGTTGVGISLIAIEAARMTQQGLSLDEITNRCQALSRRIQMLLVLPSIKPLVRSKLLPAEMNCDEHLVREFNTIFSLYQGGFQLLSTVHNKVSALRRLAQQVIARCRSSPMHGGLMHSTCSDEVTLVGDILAARLNVKEFYAATMHPNLTKVMGQGVLAVAFYTSEP